MGSEIGRDSTKQPVLCVLSESVRRHRFQVATTTTTDVRVAPVHRAVSDSLSHYAERLPATASLLRETHARQVQTAIFTDASLRVRLHLLKT